MSNCRVKYVVVYNCRYRKSKDAVSIKASLVHEYELVGATATLRTTIYAATWNNVTAHARLNWKYTYATQATGR